MTRNPTLKTFDLDGTSFHYLEQGRGSPLLFVHGTLGDYRSWKRQMDPFAEQYRVISISRRYHYPGTWNGGTSDYSAARQGDDLARIIEVLGLGRTHIVASSFGAYVTVFAAMYHPELIRSLVFGEPPAFPILNGLPNGPSYWSDFDRRAWTPARHSLERGDDEAAVRYFMDGVLGPGSFDRLPQSARSLLLENVPALKAEVSSVDYLSDIRCEMLKRIQAPTLLLEGGQSPEMFHLISGEFARCLPHCERATVPDASHAIHNQNPKFYNRVVLEFLRRHS